MKMSQFWKRKKRSLLLFSSTMLWQLPCHLHSSTRSTDSSIPLLISSPRFSNSIWLIEGISYSENSAESPITVGDLPSVSQAPSTSISGTGSGVASTSLNRISQFFWMKEQNRFLILFSGRPGRCLLISDHLLPNRLYSSNMRLSQISLQSSFRMVGSSLLMNRSRICFPFLLPSNSDNSFQFLPYFLINLRMVSSSSADQILWLRPAMDSRRNRCRHWFSFRSIMRPAISAHRLGSRQQSSSSWESSSLVQVLTLRLVTLAVFCRTSIRISFPSLPPTAITNSRYILLLLQAWKIAANQSHPTRSALDQSSTHTVPSACRQSFIGKGSTELENFNIILQEVGGRWYQVGPATSWSCCPYQWKNLALAFLGQKDWLDQPHRSSSSYFFFGSTGGDSVSETFYLSSLPFCSLFSTLRLS